MASSKPSEYHKVPTQELEGMLRRPPRPEEKSAIAEELSRRYAERLLKQDPTLSGPDASATPPRSKWNTVPPKAQPGVPAASLRLQSPPTAPVSQPPDADERISAALAHLIGVVTSFVGPLVMVVVTKNGRTGFSRAAAVEALNFQLSLLIIAIVTLGIGSLLYLVAWIFCIMAAINAGNGRRYRYPLTMRIVH